MKKSIYIYLLLYFILFIMLYSWVWVYICVCVGLYLFCIYPNPSPLAWYDTRWYFKRIKAGFNSVFSSPWKGCLTNGKKQIHSSPNNLYLRGKDRKCGSILLHGYSSKLKHRQLCVGLVDSISHGDNRYTKLIIFIYSVYTWLVFPPVDSSWRQGKACTIESCMKKII